MEKKGRRIIGTGEEGEEENRGLEEGVEENRGWRRMVVRE
jgi:hypothetical protein